MTPNIDSTSCKNSWIKLQDIARWLFESAPKSTTKTAHYVKAIEYLDVLIHAAESGELEATEVDIKPRGLAFLWVSGRPEPEHKPVMGFNGSSKASPLDLVKFCNDKGWKIPIQLSIYIDKQELEDFDINPSVERFEGKALVVLGALTYAYANRHTTYKQGEAIKIDPFVKEIIEPLLSVDGEGYLGFKNSSLRGLLKVATEAYENVKKAN